MSTSTHHIVVDIYGEQIQVGGQWFHAERIFGRAASTFTVGQPVPELQSARPAPATNKLASDDADEWVQCDLFRESGANVTDPAKIERYAQDMIAYGGWGSFPLVTGRIHCVTPADVDRYQELDALGHAHELAWSRPLRPQDVGTRYIHLENGHHRAHAARAITRRGHTISMPAHDLEREEATFGRSSTLLHQASGPHLSTGTIPKRRPAYEASPPCEVTSAIMAKQSPQDRAHRLSEGRCPIHGTPMTQVGNMNIKGRDRFLAACPRRDCDIQATSDHPTGPCDLLPEFEHLLHPRP